MKKLLSFVLALILCLTAASWAAADDMSEEANLVF